MGDVQEIGGAALEQRSGQLVNHQDQDVGFGHFARPFGFG